MKHLQKMAWLGGLLVATSGLASPAFAGDLDITGDFSMKGNLPIQKGKFTEVALPLANSGKLGFEKAFDLEEGSISGVLKLGLGRNKNENTGLLEKINKLEQDVKQLQDKGDQTENTQEASKIDTKSVSPSMKGSSLGTLEILEAYLDYGMLRMGISKSILSDKDSAPTVLGSEFSKPAGGALPQFRWTLANDELTYAFAAEVAEDMEFYEAKNGIRLPDFIASANYEIDEESHIKSALGLKVRKPGDNIDFKISGLLAGKYSIAPEVAVMGQVAVSELDPSKIVKIKNTVSGVLGLEYQFLPEATGTLAWTADAGTVTSLGGNVAANIMYDMTSNLSAGAEFNVVNALKDSRNMGISTVVSLKL